MHRGLAAPKSVGGQASLARLVSHLIPFARLKATPVPSGSAGLPLLPSPSCHRLPHRFYWRWCAGPGQEGRAHQPLPTDRTALWMFFTLTLALALRIQQLGGLYRPLSQLMSAPGQRVALAVGIEAPTAHPHGVKRRDRAEQAPNDLRDGHAHRPLLRRAPWALGPLFRPTDHLLAIACE
jgi:hypothetical protein